VAKKKLIHFQENLTFPHLFQPGYKEVQSGFHLRSQWNHAFFKNQNPVVIELGCGKGEYTVGLAAKYPKKNLIGIDFKGSRLWRGCKTVSEQGLKNVAFVRTRVDYLENLFGPREISEIWITFPDPQPGKERKRLTAPLFLNKYKTILTNDGIIHLKTDNQFFFDYSLGIVNEFKHHLLFTTEDLYNSGLQEDVIQIQTYYENIWLKEGKRIYYIKFSLNTGL
jgi:tRNA (guanine-N7-)-methyltransferase